MLDFIFQPLFTNTFTFQDYVICILASFVMGIIIALASSFKSNCSKGFITSLIILPAIVQTVIMLVNGNIGTGVAVAGAFSLVRFRSVAGKAKDIISIFLAMSIGLATATGYIGIAAIFTLIMTVAFIVLAMIRFKGDKSQMRELKITIPESLSYSHAFDDLFEKYTSQATLVHSKTTNMGSLYKLTYHVKLKSPADEQGFINDIRTRNGNLEISVGIILDSGEEL